MEFVCYCNKHQNTVSRVFWEKSQVDANDALEQKMETQSKKTIELLRDGDSFVIHET